MNRRRLVPVLVVAAFGLATGCTAGRQTTRGDQSILTPEEIATTRASNLLEAIEQLRPRWLQVRAPRSITSETRVLVYTHRSYVGGVEALRQFDTKNIVRVRYLDAAQATATLSIPTGQSVEGAIVIELIAGGGPTRN